MDRINNRIIRVLLAVLLLAGCSRDGELAVPDEGRDRIVLRIASEREQIARAVKEEGTSLESKLEKLDVFIFTADGKRDYHESVAPAGGTAVLDKAKSDFGVREQYSIYLVANSVNPSTSLNEVTTLSDLLRVTETSAGNSLLYQLDPLGENGSFLMSGKAESVVLNDESDENTVVEIGLARAAAKIEVTLVEGMNTNGTDDEGDDYRFRFADRSSSNTFRLNNWLATSFVFPEVNAATLPAGATPRKAAPYAGNIVFGPTGEGDARTITLTTYSYSNNWTDGGGLYGNMTHLVVQVPYLAYDNASRSYATEPTVSNYYTIPVTNGTLLKPNYFYRVRVTLRGAGADTPGGETPLEDIDYSVVPWEEVGLEIGGSVEPHYLTLNENELEMFNLAEDGTSLMFSSSSQVQVRNVRAYFYNKYGVETAVPTNISNEIKITPDETLNGKLDIYSPVPTNNLIRYIEFEVWNGDDECDPITVTVKQYPQEYITSYFGYYSYRSDFGFHYENRNQTPRNVSVSYDRNGNKTLNTSTVGFFTSKVVENQPSSYDNTTDYPINYYYWLYNGMRTTRSETANPRMYHVQINSSALPEFPADAKFDAEYKDFTYELGIPRKENGLTARDEANNKLVSPSFMIASRLGAVSGNLSNYSDEVAYKIAADQCEQYVEVYYPRDEKGNRLRDENGDLLPAVVLDDWRLPTKAELLIIMRYQGTSNQGTDAMDYLLNWGYYMSAEGKVFNPYYSTSSSSTAIRCVRDHYENKETKK